MQEQGKWKLALAQWRAKRRSKRQQAAERQYSARRARLARRPKAATTSKSTVTQVRAAARFEVQAGM